MSPRSRRWTLALALAATTSCRGSTDTVEPGAMLLRVGLEAGAQTPDELRLYAYDDSGALWTDARFPSEGTLMPQSASVLGTILLQPGTTVGKLRFDLRGLRGGAMVDEAILIVTPAERASGTFDVSMSAALPSDADGDGVPDPIDDCPAVPDPAQTGCGSDAGATGGMAGGPAGASGSGGSGGRAGTVGSGGGSGGRAGAPGSGGGSDGEAGMVGTGGGSGGRGGAPGIGGGSGGQAGTVGTGGGSGGQAGRVGTGGGSGGQAGRVGTGGGSGGQPGAGGSGGPAGAGGGGTGGRLGLGVSCQTAGQCATGFCKDGVCCDSACTDACKSCTTGVCTTVTSGQDIPECAAPMSCNPKGKCVAN